MFEDKKRITRKGIKTIESLLPELALWPESERVIRKDLNQMNQLASSVSRNLLLFHRLYLFTSKSSSFLLMPPSTGYSV